MAFSMTKVDQQVNGTTGHTQSFTVNTGTPDPTRVILVLVTSRFNQSTATFGQMLIGGTGANQVSGAQTNPSSQDLFTDAQWLAVPTGTSTTVVTTCAFASDTQDRSQVAVYSIIGGASAPSSAACGAATSSGTSSATVSVPSGGEAACAWMNRVQVGSLVWHGATLDSTSSVSNGGPSDVSCGHTSTSGSVSVTDAGGDFSSVLVTVSWAPAAGGGPTFTDAPLPMMGVG